MMPSEFFKKKEEELEDHKSRAYPKISNSFIENVIASSNENALKIVWYLSMAIKSSDINAFQDNNVRCYTIIEKDIIKETGLDARTILKYLKTMQKTTITFIDEKEKYEEYIQLIPRVKNNHDGTINYDIYDIVAKLIMDVADNTSGTYVDVRRLLKLKNKHSIRLLPLLEKILNNNGNALKQKTVNLEYLNSLFGTRYKRYSQLIKFVLESVQEELDNNSSLSFTYKTNRETLGKAGKPPIISITITPKTNNNYQSTIFSNLEYPPEDNPIEKDMSENIKEYIEAPTQEYITKKPTPQAMSFGESIDLLPNQIMAKFREFQEWELGIGKKRSFLTYLKIGYKNNWDF